MSNCDQLRWLGSAGSLQLDPVTSQSPSKISSRCGPRPAHAVQNRRSRGIDTRGELATIHIMAARYVSSRKKISRLTGAGLPLPEPKPIDTIEADALARDLPDPRARHELTTRVHARARGWALDLGAEDDADGVAAEGLQNAVDDFDPAYGVPFFTHARNKVRAAMYAENRAERKALGEPISKDTRAHPKKRAQATRLLGEPAPSARDAEVQIVMDRALHKVDPLDLEAFLVMKGPESERGARIQEICERDGIDRKTFENRPTRAKN